MRMVTSLLALGWLLLPGCPVYPEDGGCYRDGDCPRGLRCDVSVGLCYYPYTVGRRCGAPDQCRVGETCTAAGRCQPGDCSLASQGCVAGYSCAMAGGLWACTASGGTGGHGGEAGAAAGRHTSGGIEHQP